MIAQVVKELTSYDTIKFSEYLSSNSLDDKSCINLLGRAIEQPNNIYVHKNKKREQRENFFVNLEEILLENELHESITYINTKRKIISATETIFDNISDVLSICEVEKISYERQVWAHIGRAEEELDEIFKKSEELINNRRDAKSAITTGSFLLKDDFGNVFDPDVAIEKLTNSLSLTISLLAYKNNSYVDGIIIMPDKIPVTDDDKFKSGSTQLFAMSWQAIEDIGKRCLLFGGQVIHCIGEDVPEDARIKGGVKESFHFVREETDFEVFDSIANQRLNKKIFQDHFEMLHDKHLEKFIVSDIKDLKDGFYLSIDEISTIRAIQDIFHTNLIEDESLYNGLRLIEWVKAYSCLKYICKCIKDSIQQNVISTKTLENYFSKSGLDREKARIFIDIVTFGRDSRDFFDCPLLKLSNDNYYVFSHSFLNSNLTVLILSRMSSLEVVVGNKGYNFERNVINKLTNLSSGCRGFKFKRGSNEYEYDAVFILNGKIFVIECKNRTLSGSNIVLSHRKKQFMDENVLQIDRLVKALLSHPEVMEEHFGINVSDYDIVPVILNCMPFSWKGKYKNVYFTDSSSLNRFLASGHINAVVSKSKGKQRVLEKSTVYKLWESETPSADDLIRQFENPIQLQGYLKSRVRDRRWFPSDNTSAFTVDTFYTDNKLLKKNEKKIFGINVLPKKKKNKKSNKRKAKKISRRKNRR
ncbi:NERD domain-containing protein [Vibrio parahaemolyticus]|nr:NERD domain-containing protein [Vibrio parahaemolyticus]EKG2654627.1 NERD domain-containing protein [Vibrio parahaemolyticus]